MNKKEVQKRIKALSQEINHHNWLYHVQDKPQLSDATFDSLKKELTSLEKEFPDLITADSPTQRVGGSSLDKFEKIKHFQPMLSLEDVFEIEEIEAWQKRIQKLVPNQKLDFFSEYKVDGFAISLIYEKSFLSQAATRGDGQVGEAVTQNIKTINSIPLSLKLHQSLKSKEIDQKLETLLKTGRIEIRGEIYMSKQAFEEVNRQRKKEGLSLYANPRNTAAGSIRQLDPVVAASRQLNFLAYSLVTDLGQQTHQQEHQIVAALGFKTDPGQSCQNLKEVISTWQKIAKQRQKLNFQIDGVVVSVNDRKIFQKLGQVGRAPRGAIAFKFAAEEATTIVEDILVQVGRTGTLTPVASLRPVKIGGTLVTRATLHNLDEIKRLDIKIGDTVVVQRAGDVIPDVVEVLKKLRTGQEKEFKMPSRCPVCGSQVIRLAGEVAHRCGNKDCGAIQKLRINHFVSKKGFNIVGLGPQIVNQLMDEGLISNQADIFKLKEGDLASLKRFAQKSAQNLVQAIEKSKKIALTKFIFALGILHVGEETALILAKEVSFGGKIEKVADFVKIVRGLSLEQLQTINDVGPVVGQSIFNFFNDKKNLELLNDLNEAGIGLDIPFAKKKAQKLANKSFVLTGELANFTRDQAKQKVRELGGRVSSAVSKNTDYLIAGHKAGSKYEKAKSLRVPILSEKDFLNLIK